MTTALKTKIRKFFGVAEDANLNDLEDAIDARSGGGEDAGGGEDDQDAGGDQDAQPDAIQNNGGADAGAEGDTEGKGGDADADGSLRSAVLDRLDALVSRIDDLEKSIEMGTSESPKPKHTGGRRRVADTKKQPSWMQDPRNQRFQ